MFKKWFFILPVTFSFYSGQMVWAQNSEFNNLISVGSENIQTTSEFQSTGCSIAYELSNKVFDKASLGTLYASGKANDLNYKFQSIQLSFESRAESRRLYSQISLDNRSTNQTTDSVKPFGKIGGDWTFLKSNLIFEFGKKNLALELQSLVSLKENLDSKYYLIRYNLLLAEKLQLRALHKVDFVSDSNQRSDSDVGLMYAISADWPWIWAGIGTGYLANTNGNATGYWAPRQFINFGPRLDLAVPLVGKYSLSAGLNINKYHDVDFGSGTGVYSIAKIIYGSKDALKGELGFEYINSEQNSNKWTSSTLSVGVMCPF